MRDWDVISKRFLSLTPDGVSNLLFETFADNLKLRHDEWSIYYVYDRKWVVTEDFAARIKYFLEDIIREFILKLLTRRNSEDLLYLPLLFALQSKIQDDIFIEAVIEELAEYYDD